jgi:hypothetical protein
LRLPFWGRLGLRDVASSPGAEDSGNLLDHP